jgi:hypothetical protein
MREEVGDINEERNYEALPVIKSVSRKFDEVD